MNIRKLARVTDITYSYLFGLLDTIERAGLVLIKEKDRQSIVKLSGKGRDIARKFAKVLSMEGGV